MKVYVLTGHLGETMVETSVHRSWEGCVEGACHVTSELAMEAEYDEDAAELFCQGVRRGLVRSMRDLKYREYEQDDLGIEWRICERTLEP